ncbi:ABC transporter substrate-binding protein [Bradyrhizobium sp. WSM4349]|uniref:ABC transporter substrate-binding protein n=1 Tax=Bradyrhizobium sp. WSM4349 TaxID=1040988 RepID=UPI0003A8A8E9|nr:ABC transporter substrate-binding protein [Bradyrhizobium sp. WSM4349]
MKKSLMNGLAAMGLTAGLLAQMNAAIAGDQLTITGGGGSFQKILREVVFEPFSKSTGTKVTDAEYDYGTAKIRAMVETKTVSWDIVYAGEAQTRQMCDEGLIETLDWKKLETFGLDRAKFGDASYTDCGVPSTVTGDVIMYDAKRLPSSPKTIEDFFDLKKFPGKRGLNKSPVVILEWALIADGVSINDVYKVLSTPEGVARAFKRLDTIKKDVVWWTSGAQPAQLLADGEVVMTHVWTTRAYDANKNSGKHFEYIWDAALQAGNAWVIPKGSPNIDAGYKFLAFAGSAHVQAEVANGTSAGPANKDALKLIDPAVRPYVTNAPERSGITIQRDTNFWNEKGDELRQRLTAWLAQ